MTNKTSEHEVEVTAVAHGGSGICRIEGQVCFVAYGLPGDRLRIRVVRQTKGVLWGEIVEVLKPSPDRLDVAGRHFGHCGGCAWLHFAYPAQARWKLRIVRDALLRVGGIDFEPQWLEDDSLRTGYRTRAEFHGRQGRLGFYAMGTHEVQSAEPCPLLHPRLAQALERLQEMKADGPIEVTVDPEGSDVMVWSKRPPQQHVQEFFPIVGWSNRPGDPGHFMFEGVPVVNGTFSQASLLLNRMLVKTVHDMIGSPALLLDLYSGAGNFSITLDGVTDLLGLDHSRDAVTAANRVRPGCYRVADERDFALELEKAWDVVLLDPPRQGAKDIVQPLAESPAGAIVYVSCDPATLARDLKALCSHGWGLVRCTVLDMFPGTPHVETVCRLERQA